MRASTGAGVATLLVARDKDSGVAGLLSGNRPKRAGVFERFCILLSAAGSDPDEYAESFTGRSTECLVISELGDALLASDSRGPECLMKVAMTFVSAMRGLCGSLGRILEVESSAIDVSGGAFACLLDSREG